MDFYLIMRKCLKFTAINLNTSAATIYRRHGSIGPKAAANTRSSDVYAKRRPGTWVGRRQRGNRGARV